MEIHKPFINSQDCTLIGVHSGREFYKSREPVSLVAGEEYLIFTFPDGSCEIKALKDLDKSYQDLFEPLINYWPDPV